VGLRRPNGLNRFSSYRASCPGWLRPAAAAAVPELDLQAILRQLVEGEVEFLLIGGVAVGYHGHVRATKDVDVVPAPHRENLERLAEILRRLDARVAGAEEFGEEELPDPLDPAALELGGNWVLATSLGRLDIMQWIGDWPLWAQLSPNAIEDTIGDLPIKIVSYDDLVRLKELAGRPEDLADLTRLREAREN
jgi:predicted nucleotidyltransferase